MPILDSLSDFEKSTVTELGKSKTVYRIGNSGPCVLVCHEIPGITPTVAGFARHVAAQGFRVSVPSLVGNPGAAPSKGELAKSVAKVCISKEFSLFAAGASAPIVDWLRAFGRSEHQRCGGPGIGVVGMCFSGGFALALATDEHVLAPVMSQPAIPVKRPGKAFSPHSIDVSTTDLARIRARLEADPALCVSAYRFSEDPTVPAERFAYLREQLGERFVGVTFDSSPGNPDGYRQHAHSVLTEHLVRSARDEVIALFNRQLLNRTLQ
jgi:dienelactone hydrolase